MSGTPSRVLVVDDFAETAEVACALLGLRGLEARAAATAAEALAEARRFVPHVAIVDICLPDMCGFDLVEQLRATPGAEDVYCVALTGWSRPGDVERAYAAGFDRYVLKPINSAALAQIVKSASRRRTARQPHGEDTSATGKVADVDGSAVRVDRGARDR